jgi:hypothetical protein
MNMQSKVRKRRRPDEQHEKHSAKHRKRAATSLARLLRKQGNMAEARDTLAPVYNWFTEGLDTADLKDAKALLDELDG